LAIEAIDVNIYNFHCCEDPHFLILSLPSLLISHFHPNEMTVCSHTPNFRLGKFRWMLAETTTSLVY